jgi:hypothetical protein
MTSVATGPGSKMVAFTPNRAMSGAMLLRADSPETGRAKEQRRGMAAAEQLDLGAVGADLGEDSGDELLIAELAGQAGLDAGDDRGQAVLLVGSLAEYAEDRRRRRWQALALRVAYHEPHPVRGGHYLVKVAADAGTRGGR